MEGGSLVLAAYGEEDLYLTGNPQMTYFQGVYKRYTNFAIEQIRQYPDGYVNFGQRTYFPISREGDLIGPMFLNILLPQLPQDPDNPCFSSSWINSIGHALIEYVTIEIGGVEIAREYGVWMEIWDEISVSDDTQYGLFDMIGKHEYFNSTMQTGPLELHIPLGFWFTRNPGLSLPIVAIQHHEVRIGLSVRNFEQLWCSSNGQLGPIAPNTPGGCGQGSTNSIHILEAYLYVETYFLDDAERRAFAQGRHSYLIEQVQIETMGLSRNQTAYQVPLHFTNLVKEVIWVIKHDTTCVSGIPENGNEFFNFSDRTVSDPGIPEDPMLTAKFQMEGNDIMDLRTNKYFREVVPYLYHTRVPRNFIYVYSFCHYPENWVPSGTINLSRIDSFVLHMNVKQNLPAAQFMVFAVNYNILRIEGGMAGVIYKN